MSFLKKIAERILGSSAGEFKDPDGIYLYIQCANCGSPIRVRADKKYDLQRDYESGALTLHKEIMDGKCFRLIYATLQFDAAYHIVNQTIEGGNLISWEEYQALTRPVAPEKVS